MSCKVKNCEEMSVAMFPTLVRGFIPESMDIMLCEYHAKIIYEKVLSLKNGGRIDAVESHCAE